MDHKPRALAVGARKILFVVIANFLIAGAGLHVLSSSLFAMGRIPESCRGTVLRSIGDLFRKHWADDSWGPMLAALQAFREHPGASIYQTVFFEERIKFQYPLATLLPLWLMQQIGFSTSTIHIVLEMLSWLAVMGTAAVAAAIMLRSADGPTSRLLLASIALIASLSFYPVMWAYQIGQIQVFGNLLFSIVFYCWLTDRQRAAGIAVGLLAIMKPQFLVVLAWGFVRRRWSFAWAGLIITAIGNLSAVLLFGATRNWEYVSVLAYISRHGESYYPNQSFNGVLQRLVQNGSSLDAYSKAFPPYQPVIYILTLASSAALVLWALRLKSAPTREARIMDFSLISIVATAASPIAWYHHYGVLLPVLCWLFVEITNRDRWSRRDRYLILAAYVLVANDPRITNLAAHLPVINLLQSTFFAGVLLLMSILSTHASLFSAPKKEMALAGAVGSS